MTNISPKNIVSILDRHIIGQQDGKRAVAIALRNRWRRLQLPEEISQEITPKNILMIGPTGVGKTEIARRLARLSDAPFLKVEATKFTEVGYVGRDVESIVRDLVNVALKNEKDNKINLVHKEALDRAEEKILDILLPQPKSDQKTKDNSNAKQIYRKKLREGELDHKEIELELKSRAIGVDIMTPPGMEEMAGQLQDMFSQFGRNSTQKRRMTIKNALKALADDEAERLISDDEIKHDAIKAVENRGIVFLDELDKVCRREATHGSDVSREGVQRDLLPLIEGTTVQTKFGNVRTDHILFIASGAFHLAKPSDLIPELQGRLPIRVELKALTPADFSRILTEPDHSLIKQYQALLMTEGVELIVHNDAISAIAELAFKVNEQTENIGARRLHTLLERLLEMILFRAGDGNLTKLEIDRDYVQEKLADISEDRDLSRYVL